MAAVSPFTSRMPFGAIDNPRSPMMHPMVPNHKDATGYRAPVANMDRSFKMPPIKETISSPKKRRLPPSIFEDVDTENIDPTNNDSSAKRSKSDQTTSKRQILCLDEAFPAGSVATKFCSPATVTTVRKPSAGRSPKQNTVLTRRRVSAPMTRVDPPTHRKFRPPMTMNFSIDAILAGTSSTRTILKPKPKTSRASTKAKPKPMPATWFFDIYEDSPEEEAQNLMEHSAGQLYISDDDSRDSEKKDLGKENTPPPDHVEDLAASLRAQFPQMSDAAREVLAELRTSDFFGEGLDADSVDIFEDETFDSSDSEEEDSGADAAVEPEH